MMRAYCKHHAVESGFPMKDYAFPDKPGECDATLALKVWGRRKDLLCYFDTDSGEKLLLCTLFDIHSDRAYRPQECDLDLSYVEIGSRLHIRYEAAKPGMSHFMSAKLLE